MAKIIIEIVTLSGSRRDIRVYDKESVSVGRGYNNDLILNDPCVSEAHAVIRVSEEGQLSVEDLDSCNGTVFLGLKKSWRVRKKIFGTEEIDSGGKFSCGNTIIRVFHPQHPVAATKIMERRKPLSGVLVHRKITTWYAVIGFLLLYFINTVVDYPYVDPVAGRILFLELLGLVGIAVWAGFWSLIGRMIRQKFEFRAHFTIACFFVIVIIPIANISAFLGFVFIDSFVEILIFYGLFAIALAFLLFAHKSYATLLSTRVRLISSISIPVVLSILIGFGYFSYKDNFSSQPSYYPRLKPPIIHPVKTYEIDDFVVLTGKVFEAAVKGMK